MNDSDHPIVEIVHTTTTGPGTAQDGVVDLSLGLVVVVLLALAFDLTNGFHDSSNSLAAPVATRAMTPRQALVVTTVFTLLGPIIAGTAVADTVGGLIEVGTDDILGILLAALRRRSRPGTC